MYHKRIIIVASLLAVSCNKVEPIEIIAPEREVDVATLTQYKSNLESRAISVGMIYGWGSNPQSVLMQTPDSLDIIVVKDGWKTLTENQKQDLAEVRQKKATKVFVGVDFETDAVAFQDQYNSLYAAQVSEKEQEWKASGEALTEAQKQKIITKIGEDLTAQLQETLNQKLEQLSTEIFKKLQNENFDGVSVEFPQEFNFGYTQEKMDNFLSQMVSQTGKGKKYYLMLENMYGERPKTTDATPSDVANWIVYRKKDNTLLENITGKSQDYPNPFLASTDFSEEDWKEGYLDSKTFLSSGKPSRPAELVNWQSNNRAGVAFYHIEKNQLDLSGKTTYHTLRTVIHQLQLKK